MVEEANRLNYGIAGSEQSECSLHYHKLDVSTEVADIISAYKPYLGLSEMKMKNL